MDSQEPIQLELFTDAPLPTVIETLTWSQAARFFFVAYWRHKKMASVGKSIWEKVDHFFGHRPIHTIGKLDIERLLHTLETQHNLRSPSALNKARMYVTNLFNRLAEWRDDGFVDGHDLRNLQLPRLNPGKRVRRRKERSRDVAISPWDFGRILRICKRLAYHEVAEILRFAVWLRMSPIDLRELADHHIHDRTMQVIKARGHTRTDRNPDGVVQHIPISERMWGRIRRLQSLRPEGERRILPFKNFDRRFDHLRKVCRQEGIPYFQLRDFRRSGATYLLYEAGFDLKTVSKGLGHTTTKVTEAHYTPLPEKALRESTEALEKAFDSNRRPT